MLAPTDLTQLCELFFCENEGDWEEGGREADDRDGRARVIAHEIHDTVAPRPMGSCHKALHALLTDLRWVILILCWCGHCYIPEKKKSLKRQNKNAKKKAAFQLERKKIATAVSKSITAVIFKIVKIIYTMV